jgi:endonuclease/exonuclease/phosphatase family metal-dependent hydrolase
LGSHSGFWSDMWLRGKGDLLIRQTIWTISIRLAKMEDLKFMGWLYTWSNRRPENPILRKLDRVLVNETWMIRVVISVLLPQGISDHSPVKSFLSLQF